MLTNVIHELGRIEKLRDGEKIWPWFVDFHSSNVCNQHCQGCAYTGMLDNQYMEEEKHFRAVDLFLDHGVRAFDFAGGGEPAVIPYLPRLMNYIAGRAAHFSLITNGTLLRPELVDVLLNYGTYCRISLEASCRDDYAAYKRVKASEWDRVISSIKDLVAQKKLSGSKLEISLKFVVAPNLRGLEHYRRIYDIAFWLGVDRVNIKAVRHAPNELSEWERLAEQKIMEGFHSRMLDSIKPMYRFQIAPIPFEQVPQCWLNPIHTVLDYNGDLYICCYYYYGTRQRDLLIGNIFKQDFDSIWLSDQHRRKIANIKRKDCHAVDCKFFSHHKAVDQALTRGSIKFL